MSPTLIIAMETLSFSLFFSSFFSSSSISSSIYSLNPLLPPLLTISHHLKNVRFFAIHPHSFVFSLSPSPPSYSSLPTLEEDEIREGRGRERNGDKEFETVHGESKHY